MAWWWVRGEAHGVRLWPKPTPKAELRGPKYHWIVFVSPFTCGSLSHPLLSTSKETIKKGIALSHCAVGTRHGQNSVPTTEWPVTSLRSEYAPTRTWYVPDSK